MFGCVLPERTQQILRVARRQPPIVENCAQAQPFRLIATTAEQTGFEMIEPDDFFGARKFGMIRNVVSNARMAGRCCRLIKRDATGKFSSCEPLPDRNSPLWIIASSAHPLERAPSIGRPVPANTDTRN